METIEKLRISVFKLELLFFEELYYQKTDPKNKYLSLNNLRKV